MVEILIGGLIGLVIAFYFQKRAADELGREAKQLRHLNTMILRALENARLVKLARNAAGEITGLAFELNAEPGRYVISGSDAELTVSGSKTDT